MARFSADMADNYGGQGGAGFFSLKNDKDVAKVRFLYDSMEDVIGDSVHEIEIDGKKRYVNCLREYNDPKDKCPLCAAGKTIKAKLFVPLYDVESDSVKIWDRGKKFFGQMTQLCARYAVNEPLCSHVFEIERSGKVGDTNTSYGIFEVERDNSTLEDLPEAPEMLGGFILDKSADDMEYFLKRGVFPEDGSKSVPTDDVPFEERRRGSRGDRF